MRKNLTKVLSLFLVLSVLIASVIPMAASAEEGQVESISAVALNTITEGVGGNMTSEWNDGEQTPEYFCYLIDSGMFEYTVTYDGGKIFKGKNSELSEKFGCWPDIFEDQRYDNQWGIGKHNVTVDFMGKSCKTEIEITKSPFESISAVAVNTLTEGVDGNMTSEWNNDGQTPEYFYYAINSNTLKYTVTYDGGKIFEGDENALYQEFGYFPSVITYQSYDNQWGIGKHKVKVYFVGKSCEAEIEIMKSPIESISVVALKTVIEGTSGNMAFDWNSEGQTPEYYKYSIDSDMFEYTVTYDGGKVFNGSCYELYGTFGCWPDIFDDQSYDNQWEIGKHNVTVNFMGKSCETEIEIVKNPIESISAVATNTIVEGTDGCIECEETEEYYVYMFFGDDFKYTLTYDGGKTFKGDNFDIYEKFGSFPNISDDQSYDNQWGIGKHNVTINFMGKSCETEIEIVKSPVESISAAVKRPLTEGVNGYMVSDSNSAGEDIEYFYYTNYTHLFEYTVTYDGGNIFKGSDSELYQKFGYDPYISDNQSCDNQWGIGKHNLTVGFMGKSCKTEIEIVKNPIESISAASVNTIKEGIDGWNMSSELFGEYFFYSIDNNILEYTVIYDGGKVFKGSYNELYQKFNYWPNLRTEQDYGNQWGIGKHSVAIDFMGKSCEAEVEIVKSPFKSITISGEEELSLSFTKQDNTTVTAKILSFEDHGGWEGGCDGFLNTDIGTFNAQFTWYWIDGEPESRNQSKDIRLTIGTLESNTLKSNNWMKMHLYSERISENMLAYENDPNRNLLDFNGTITNENIDDVIWISCYATGKLWLIDNDNITEGRYTYALFDLNDVKETVATLFDTTGVDFSKAKTDADSGKVMVRSDDSGRQLNTTTVFVSFDSKNKCWNSTTKELDDDEQSVRRILTINYDQNNKVKSITKTHDHKLICHDAVAATCESDGSKKYYECSICGKLFADETCSETIDRQSTIIKATGHHYIDTVVDPTTTEQGYTEHVCSDCSDIFRDNYTPTLIPQIMVTNTIGIPGKTIKVKMVLENNSGIAKLAASLKYDESVLTLIEVQEGDIFDEYTSETNYAWSKNENVTTNGTLLTLVFSIADNAKPGNYSVEPILESCTNENTENVALMPMNGVVTVGDYMYGDANGDEEIDIKDVVLIRKYIANYDYETETSDVVIEFGADANGDGEKDIKDVVLLRKYIADYDYNIENSGILLGPQRA